MLRKVLLALGIGCALAVADIALCFLSKDWNLSFYAIMLGGLGIFISFLALWSPVGGVRMNAYERRALEMYAGTPEETLRSARKRKKIEAKTSLLMLAFSLPVIVIPIVIDVTRHVP